MADRILVEQQADTMLNGADKEDVAMLVVGDPFSATTHTDLYLRAAERGIHVEVVHNASIMNAIGCTGALCIETAYGKVIVAGLQLYAFGETISIVMWTDTWQPDSYVDKLTANRKRGLHTLCLLGASCLH